MRRSRAIRDWRRTAAGAYFAAHDGERAARNSTGVEVGIDFPGAARFEVEQAGADVAAEQFIPRADAWGDPSAGEPRDFGIDGGLGIVFQFRVVLVEAG